MSLSTIVNSVLDFFSWQENNEKIEAKYDYSYTFT